VSRHVFLSYSRANRAYARALTSFLRARGVQVWIDDRLQPGDAAWTAAIEQAIEECFAVVVIMSESSARSKWVDREMDKAQDLGRPILPLLLSGTPFLRLRDVNFVDVTSGRMPGVAFLTRLQSLSEPDTFSPLASVAAAPSLAPPRLPIDDGPMHVAQPEDAPRNSRLLTMIRVQFGILAIAALVLGFVGLQQYYAELAASEAGSYAFRDILYSDLRLFLLMNDFMGSGRPLPLTLDIARFAAPAAVSLALAEVSFQFFNNSYAAWRRRHLRGHVIVVGNTFLARSIAMGLRQSMVVLVGDGGPAMLAAAGVRGARALYACADDSQDRFANVNIVHMAAQQARSRSVGQLSIHGHIRDSELCLALQAREFARLSSLAGEKINFFNINELAARTFVSAEFPAEATDGILVAGLGTLGLSLVIEYAKVWNALAINRRRRVILVDRNASARLEHLLMNWPVVASVCDVTPIDGDLADALRLTAADRPPHRVFLCYPDEEVSVHSALTATRLWRGARNSVVICLYRLGETEVGGISIVNDLGGRLRTVHVLDLARNERDLRSDLVERLATVTLRFAAEVNAPAAHAERLHPDVSAEVPMAHGQAADIPHKLSLINCTIAARLDEDNPFEFELAEIEQLAIEEQERWIAERERDGWRSGPAIDPNRKLDPLLVPWPDLPDGAKAARRAYVAAIPTILEAEGLCIIRL
jgi:hypothetical protein